jgi:hypothetical protein
VQSMNEKLPDLPYEKALEETSKAVGKGLDLVNRAAPAIGEAYYFLIGDRIIEQRARNADKMARETKRILDERHLKETRILPEDLVEPLLEAAQKEPREELLKLFAALAANAMDPSHDDVRPEFVETVRKWQPLDAQVMKFAWARPTGKPLFGNEDVRTHTGARKFAMELSFDHLVKLECIRTHPNGGYALTSYGYEIMRATSEHPDAAA